MSQQLTTVSARLPMPINAPCTPEQWRVLTDAIFPNAKTGEAVLMALEYCRVRNLDPFKRPVHIVPMYSTASRRMIETIWPGINELQVTAARSGAWAGMDEPVWGPAQEYTFTGGGGEDDQGRPIPPKTITIKVPESCTVTVYRNVNGRREAFAEPVYWMEAYAKAGRGTELPNEMWARRPRGQLHKCAKAASLRAAFPEDLGSTYVAEEMEDKEIDGNGPAIDATPIAPQNVAQDEESEFVIRADGLLAEAAAKSSSAWLKAFIALMKECPEKADLASICAWPSVQEAREKAPTLVRGQVEDSIKAAAARLEQAATGGAPETADPEAACAADLLTKFQALPTDADVLKLAAEKSTKEAIARWTKERPDLHKLLIEGIDAKRAALNGAG